ncbi:protein kinase domain-containing protein [Micromonospora sp. NBC_01796]|uniref:protein kinase domain-containing protein n=1 Tax=Micromonospora sp. NBC_01796 TaxID=2975987 RepID=UPI002DD8AC68|nr:protein kinase [Micromonospora sp. NBC_01796]WSA84689.1 protein kinase [Micromonospora sp. NBC_01796]
MGRDAVVLAPGVLLNDRYQLDARLATGGMGDVWRGTDLLLGRQVALKVLLPALVAEPDFITRFRAEARMMATLHHPGIVQVYDCGEQVLSGGTTADYMVMEYVAGEPLSRRIEAAGRMGIEQTLSVVAQAARALDAAHRSGIVHRDVKPGNLLIQPDGTVVLVDFGVARSATMTRITSTNAVPGTALYMAPEQAAGRPVSAATDIYALGAVAYHCLAGEPPYSGKTALEVAVRHLHDPPPTPPADLPAPVAALVSRALAKAPEDRYPSAAAFAEAADAALAGTDGSVGAATAPVAGLAPVGGALAGAAIASRSTGTDGGVGTGTLPEMPVVRDFRGGPGDGTGAPVPAGARPNRASGRRAVVMAGAATLLAGGALLGVLAFVRDDGGRGQTPPVNPSATGAVPGAGPSAGAGQDDAAPSGRTSNAPAPGAPSGPAATGSPVASASTVPSATPSPAPTSARPTASQTSSEQTPPPETDAPATPDAPAEPQVPVASPGNP